MKVSEIVVVEGRDDTEAVRRAADCETIETHGFGMSEDMWKSLSTAYERKGLIIFTDPDHAGSEIRKKIRERFPGSKEAFLPRSAAVKGHDIGVENAAPEDIRKALAAAKADTGTQSGDGEPVTRQMLMEGGLSGQAGSRRRRELVADRLGIAYGSAGTLLKRINAFGITAGEFNEALRSISDKTDKE